MHSRIGLASTRALKLMLAIGLAACAGAGTTAPDSTPATSTIVVDDASATVYIALGDSARVVSSADAWDMSFLTTAVGLNADVTAYCLCASEAATGDAVMAMTAAGQSAAFEQVSSADIPAAASFSADVFATHKWYRYNITGADNQIWPVFNTYLVKRRSAVYKVQLINYYNAAGEPRHVTVRYKRIQG